MPGWRGAVSPTRASDLRLAARIGCSPTPVPRTPPLIVVIDDRSSSAVMNAGPTASSANIALRGQYERFLAIRARGSAGAAKTHLQVSCRALTPRAWRNSQAVGCLRLLKLG